MNFDNLIFWNLITWFAVDKFFSGNLIIWFCWWQLSFREIWEAILLLTILSSGNFRVHFDNFLFRTSSWPCVKWLGSQPQARWSFFSTFSLENYSSFDCLQYKCSTDKCRIAHFRATRSTTWAKRNFFINSEFPSSFWRWSKLIDIIV